MLGVLYLSGEEGYDGEILPRRPHINALDVVSSLKAPAVKCGRE